MLPAIRQEIRPMLRLAVPVVLAEFGWTTMALVDTLMVGPLGPAAIGAVGFGSIVFVAVAVFGMSQLLGLDTEVSQAFGAGRPADCHRWLIQGLYLALLVSAPILALAYAVVASLPRWGLNEHVLALAVGYLRILAPSMVPLLFYAAFRRYLQAMNTVRPITFTLLSANLVNLVANWILVYGRFGAPAMGVEGSAWATLLSRLYMAAALGISVLLFTRRHHESWRDTSWRIDTQALRRLVGLGFPASVQNLLEIGVFAAASSLVARLSSEAVAAHQIALNLWSFAYMVPFGLSSAGAVRVGHAVGRRDAHGTWRAGWTALALGAASTITIAVVFLSFGRVLIAAFSSDATVLALGPPLLGIAGLCLVFDGTQGISTGLLRGLGETRVPMAFAAIGYWVVALPLGYTLCFRLGYGVSGMWSGLAVGLVVVGSCLLTLWRRRVPGARRA